MQAAALLSVGIPALLLASTAFFLWWTEPVYEGVTTIRIDQERSGVAIIEALRNLSSGSKITTEMEELRSRTLAEAVVDSLGLNVTMRQPRKVARSAVFDRFDAGRQARASALRARADRGTFRLTGGDGAARRRSPSATSWTCVGRVHARCAAPSRTTGSWMWRVSAMPSAGSRAGSASRGRTGRRISSGSRTRARTRRSCRRCRTSSRACSWPAATTSGPRRPAARAISWPTQIALLHAQLTTTEDELRAFQERYGVLGHRGAERGRRPPAGGDAGGPGARRTSNGRPSRT
jgi:hypothetical protein